MNNNPTSDGMISAEVYYTRFDIEANESPDDFHLARDLRGGYADAETLSLADFRNVYEFIGEADGEDLDAIYNTAQETGDVRSMMMGDLIVLDSGEVYMVDRIGYSRLPALESAFEELEAEREEAEAACARAEIAAEARMEQRFARHVDEHGWF